MGYGPRFAPSRLTPVTVNLGQFFRVPAPPWYFFSLLAGKDYAHLTTESPSPAGFGDGMRRATSFPSGRIQREGPAGARRPGRRARGARPPECRHQASPGVNFEPGPFAT